MPFGEDSPFRLLLVGSVALVLVTVILLVSLAVLGGMTASLSSTGSGGEERTSSPLIDTGSATSFEDTSGASITRLVNITDSNGFALRFSGADDSNFSSSETLPFDTDDNWTVSTWGKFNDSFGTTNGTLLSIDGRLLIQYNNNTTEWVVWYHQDGPRDSYNLTADATAQPDTLVTIQVVANTSHIALYRNNTRTDVANLSVSSNEDPLNNTSNWAGTIEESRVYEDNLTSSQRQALIDNPVQPISANRSFRLMYDEGSGLSEPIYFASGTLQLSNITWIEGFAGNNLVEGTDYDINLEQGSVTALAGGLLDGAPTVWITYEIEDRLADLVAGIQAGYSLFGTAVLIIPAVAVLGTLLVSFVLVTQLDAPTVGRGRNGR